MLWKFVASLARRAQAKQRARKSKVFKMGERKVWPAREPPHGTLPLAGPRCARAGSARAGAPLCAPHAGDLRMRAGKWGRMAAAAVELPRAGVPRTGVCWAVQ